MLKIRIGQGMYKGTTLTFTERQHGFSGAKRRRMEWNRQYRTECVQITRFPWEIGKFLHSIGNGEKTQASSPQGLESKGVNFPVPLLPPPMKRVRGVWKRRRWLS